ncbi:hypothetical protein NUU61_006914 [Penicillium alfredii]|uniref:Uncharacterized protein n=1 Tax=Penicillium alfredii TaxID=1506179 RepID=A0A9W9F1U9_9EURO|nr:uncharacterized protein NUU61_006914 [Penicillium alfredii]KAJ5092044.1 hypothetical protein NUU61_006914 [Penicillium alfredii]
MSNYPKPTDTTGVGIAHGSSTGAPGAPTGVQDTRAQYDPTSTGYNSATGAGYSTSSAGGPHHHHHEPASPSNSYDLTARQDDRIQHAPSTAQRAKMEDQAQGETKGDKVSGLGSRASQASEDVGRGAKGAAAGIHGAGESLRGALNAAVDRAFGSNEGAERNQEIARKGEQEIQTGQFSSGR